MPTLAILSAAPGQPPALDLVALGLSLVAGLALFLYGVSLLAGALRATEDGRMRAVLARATVNRVTALAAGAGATVLLDSSSVAIILLIALIDARQITFDRALPAVLGANIGTTVSSQIFAWSLDEWSPLIVAAGLAWRAMARNETGRAHATAVLGFGLVLYGLHTLGVAAEPLKSQPAVIEALARLEDPWSGALAGAVATVVIQSSSAMMGIAIALAAAGLVTVPAGVAIMLGAEIGTCADTLIAAAGRGRAALKTGLFHLGFNVLSVAAGLFFIGALIGAAQAMGGDTGQQIANIHVLFNVVGALLMLPFTGHAARLLERLVPEHGTMPVRRMAATAAE